jgi:hypothetical protein
MFQTVQALMALTAAQWRKTSGNDEGATAIEWAIFALLALAVGGTVAAAITLAVSNRAPNIK